MRVLVTRPRQDCEETASRLAALGHEAICASLLAVQFHDGAELSFDGVQAILATSANGIRALARRTTHRDLPVFAVGPQTAKAARQAGFAQVKNADGDALALAQATSRWADPAKGALLHVSGERDNGRLASALTAHGFTLRKEVLYEVVAETHLPPQAAKALADGALDAALFFSPRSARIFRECVTRENLDAACGDLLAVCISAATAEALKPLTFRPIWVAQAPNQDSLLACLA